MQLCVAFVLEAGSVIYVFLFIYKNSLPEATKAFVKLSYTIPWCLPGVNPAAAPKALFRKH